MSKRTNLVVAALAFGCVWFWQYTKFAGGYGLFYSISPEYGAWILSAVTVLVAAVTYIQGNRIDSRKK